MGRRALIYGITGQDGSYLSKFLVSKGYTVAGVAHKARALEEMGIRVFRCDLAGKPAEYLAPMDEFCPDEVYNFAALHLQDMDGANAKAAHEVNATAPLRMLEHLSSTGSKARFFQASSAYVYAGRGGIVGETTVPSPNSDYARTKLEAQAAVADARKSGAYACAGILFNHESPMRGGKFVTGKIALAAARIAKGSKEPLYLGNLDAKRDWGFAGDYVEAMWLMLQQKEPDDYVVATGESHSVREFCQEAFSHAGLDWEKYVRADPALFRPEEKELVANTEKIRSIGWEPKVGFKELVHMMVDCHLGIKGV